jgi:hypothetical protein
MGEKQGAHTFSLSIAGIGVSLICDDPRLVAELNRHYQAFPHSGGIHLEVDVQIVDAADEERLILEPGADFKNGLLCFTNPGYEGFVDEVHGAGSLCVSRTHPIEYIEYYLRVAYALLAFHTGGILFHAAGIVRQGKAYLFFGHSGSGKTTVSRLSSNDLVLNDDLNLLLPGESGWVAYATPFWNPNQVQPTPSQAPLAGLYRLVQDKRVFLEEVGSGQALAELISSVPVIPLDPLRSLGLLARSRRLIDQVPLFRLHFLPDDTFWQVVDPA